MIDKKGKRKRVRLRRKECKKGKEREEGERREINGQRNTAAAVIIAY
jgi:hypothetical protein